MSHIVVLGGGIGGVSCAYELRKSVRREDRVTLISNKSFFQFTPSNPWVAVKWRSKDDIIIELAPVLSRHGIGFSAAGAKRVHPSENRIELGDGSSVDYDYLVVATGPELAFDEIEGFGPEHNTNSICDVDHAAAANTHWEEFCKNPGPIVVGGVQGASCFGPAYEFAMIMDTDLRQRRIRDKVPMTFVTAEPYIGHLGVGGVGDTKGVLESEMRQRHIKWIVNAKVDKVDADKVRVTEVDDDGKPKKAHEVPFKFAMMIPAFRGIAALRGIEGLTNPRGFIVVDKHQRNPKFRNVFGVGVCIAIAPLEQTASAGRRAEDRLHDRIHGDGDSAEHRPAGARPGDDARSHLERHLSGRLRRFRRGLCRHAAKSAAQRQLGVARPLGARRQGGVREILPAQSPRRHDRAVLRKGRHENSRYRQDQTAGCLTPARVSAAEESQPLTFTH